MQQLCCLIEDIGSRPTACCGVIRHCKEINIDQMEILIAAIRSPPARRERKVSVGAGGQVNIKTCHINLYDIVVHIVCNCTEKDVALEQPKESFPCCC